MSRESYIRGFCKVADKQGIDPVVLAKYAQQYKTDGWAPAPVADLGTESAPVYGYTVQSQGGESGKDSPKILNEIATPVESPMDLVESGGILSGEDGKGSDLIMESRAEIDPRFSAWLKAHSKATRDIARKVIPYYPNKEMAMYRNPSLAESIARAYHDSMLNSTGGVPKVSQKVMPRQKPNKAPTHGKVLTVGDVVNYLGSLSKE